MSLGKRRGSAWLGRALIASGVLHAGLIASLWIASSRGDEVPPLKVYAVNIVSPPPAAAGEPQPGESAAVPEPTPVAEPEPTPPAPVPEPTPPAPTPPLRPAPRPEPSPPARPTTRTAPPEPRRQPAPAEP
nr:hypothetical protein [Gemmatimonadota bacterium]